jgi:hypothetical protein
MAERLRRPLCAIRPISAGPSRPATLGRPGSTASAFEQSLLVPVALIVSNSGTIPDTSDVAPAELLAGPKSAA